MGYVVLLAGASGAIGRRLLPLLSGAGHQVIGTTRSKEKFADLRALGAEPVAVDVFDATALSEVVRAVQPRIVIHQLTDGGGGCAQCPHPRGRHPQSADRGRRGRCPSRGGAKHSVDLCTGGRNRIRRMILWTLVLLAAEPSACAALRRPSIRYCTRHRWPV